MSTTLNIASYVVRFSFDDGKPITNLALQKILYFLQYLALVKTGEPICKNMIFEAWKHSPVSRQVYYQYNLYGGCWLFPDGSISDEQYDELRCQFMGYEPYLKKWLEYNPWRLVNISRKKGCAWDRIYSKTPNAVIPLNLLKVSDMRTELGII